MSIERENVPQSELGVDRAYLNLLQDILDNGVQSGDRTGTGTLKVFGRQLKIDLQAGFPLLTTKRVFARGVMEELLWFIRGERNIRTLVQKNVHIWDEWPYKKYLQAHGLEDQIRPSTPAWDEGIKIFANQIAENDEFAKKWGDVGPVYGYLWRHWRTVNDKDEIVEVDQLKNAIKDIRNSPDSRRIIVTSWDPVKSKEALLPPCHHGFQFQVSNGKLNCAMEQRSIDTFLGLPFNIASYAALTEIIAHITNLEPGELTMHLKDTHIYLNHIDQVREQLQRDIRPLPILQIDRDLNDIDQLFMDQFKIVGYNPHGSIKAPISV